MSTRERKISITAAEAKKLRESTGLSPKQWAGYLHCSLQSVYNMESAKGSIAIGKQMGVLMMCMAYAPLRLHVIEAREHAKALLDDLPKIPLDILLNK